MQDSDVMHREVTKRKNTSASITSLYWHLLVTKLLDLDWGVYKIWQLWESIGNKWAHLIVLFIFSLRKTSSGEAVSGNLKREWQLGETEGPGCLPRGPSVSALSLTRLGQADSWHTAVVGGGCRGGTHGNTVSSRVSSNTTGQSEWSKGGHDMSMSECECVLYVGGGRWCREGGLWLQWCVCMGVQGVYMGIEEISGIVCQCSCPEWETQRNRYMGQVFQLGKKNREKEADIFSLWMAEYVCM